MVRERLRNLHRQRLIPRGDIELRSRFRVLAGGDILWDISGLPAISALQ